MQVSMAILQALVLEIIRYWNKFIIMKKTFLAALFTFSVCNICPVLSQENPEDVASVSNDFQNFYFESLKQKAIENYDKSITALEKCLKIEPNNENVYYELGKNYLFQKEYKKAYDSFEKASQINPKNQWFWVGMYDVCYETKDYNKGIIIIEKLIEFKPEFKEDLVSLYMNTNQFDNALTLINELNDKVGKSDKRDLYKAQIMQDPKYSGSEKANLLDQIKKNPKTESNYLDLILLYSKSNQEDKANEIAKKLELEIPNSDWAQVNLFKLHINNNDGEKAVNAMNIIFASKKIDDKIKHRVLNEFLIFVKTNPKYNSDLENAIDFFKNDKQVNVAKEVAKFYQNQKDWDKAIQYYELNFKNNSDPDMETTLLLFQCYTEKLQFDILEKKAGKMIEIFPSQPQFYYYAGLSNNQLKNFKKAKDFLEMGIDYLVDDKALEINFNIQLGEAYNGLGDNAKKEMYFTKAEKLLNKK
jgi:tetratricopeptide (TPR) repeat protein